jgi:ABC-type uncharacterized transport system permease subunit
MENVHQLKPKAEPLKYRSLGYYYFEGGGVLRIMLEGDVPTGEALATVETLVALKRAELAAKAKD